MWSQTSLESSCTTVFDPATDFYFKHTDWSLDDFEIGMKLGSGAFGNAYLVRTKKEHFVCVLKRIIITKFPKDKLKFFLKNIIREVEIHYSLSHNNIVRMYGFFREGNSFFIILEYIPDSTLFNRMSSRVIDMSHM